MSGQVLLGQGADSSVRPAGTGFPTPPIPAPPNPVGLSGCPSSLSANGLRAVGRLRKNWGPRTTLSCKMLSPQAFRGEWFHWGRLQEGRRYR